MKIQWKEYLWEEYLKIANVKETQKKNFRELGAYFFENVSFLYKAYELIISGKKNTIEDEKNGILFEKEDNLCILRKEKTGIFLDTQDMKSILADMIALFEDILPLGTVVDLQNDEMSKIVNVSKMEKFRVVITKRFLGDGEGCFFPYGAVVYPIGTAGASRVISFTPPLIEKVVFMGYKDETEEAFIFQMKYQLVIKQRRCSAGFSNKQEIEKMRDRISTMEEKHGREVDY